MISLAPWLHHLEQHLPIAREGKDPEGVHQVRVAGRRLRVGLELGGYRVLRDDLRWLVRGAGKVRDLEVLLQTSPPQAFAAWLAEQHREARKELLDILEAPRLEGLLWALRYLPPIPTHEAERRLARFERRVEKRKAAWRARHTPEALHALRRALRRLRYAREFLGRDAKDLKALQEALGRFNDLAVALRYLDAFETQSGQRLGDYRAALERQRVQALAEASRMLED